MYTNTRRIKRFKVVVSDTWEPEDKKFFDMQLPFFNIALFGLYCIILIKDKWKRTILSFTNIELSIQETNRRVLKVLRRIIGK